MVSLWPWKGDDNSPASFEKVLSALAEKITKSQTQLESFRQRGRRYKVLWTLYTGFVYVLCAVILFLVIGWQNWTPVEYTALAGSPVLIYLVQAGIVSYYNFRVDSVAARLEQQQAERSKTIDKLKTATKYNSTQELLEKYGGAPAKPTRRKSTDGNASGPASKDAQKRSSGRTSLGPPPPTANIGRPDQLPHHQQPSPLPVPSTPQNAPGSQRPSPRKSPMQAPNSVAEQPQAEFAPNAFPAPSQYAPIGEISLGGNWYDRILDLLLGEDETSPKNRIVLICQNCRLVNGQAPPGIKTLAGVGEWKCFACGAVNGVEDEAAKAVREMKEKVRAQDGEVVEGIPNKSANEAVHEDTVNTEPQQKRGLENESDDNDHTKENTGLR